MENEMMSCSCPACGVQFEIGKDDIGRHLQCGVCDKKFVIAKTGEATLLVPNPKMPIVTMLSLLILGFLTALNFAMKVKDAPLPTIGWTLLFALLIACFTLGLWWTRIALSVLIAVSFIICSFIDATAAVVYLLVMSVPIGLMWLPQSTKWIDAKEEWLSVNRANIKVMCVLFSALIYIALSYWQGVLQSEIFEEDYVWWKPFRACVPLISSVDAIFKGIISKFLLTAGQILLGLLSFMCFGVMDINTQSSEINSLFFRKKSHND